MALNFMADVVFTTKSFKFRDNELELNQGETGTGIADGFGGLRIKRGYAPDALIQYNETTGSWQAGIEGSVLQDIVTIASAGTYEESDIIYITNPAVTQYFYKVGGSLSTYDPSFVMVYINRMKLRKTEFIATDGSSIFISRPIEVDDEVEVVTYK